MRICLDYNAGSPLRPTVRATIGQIVNTPHGNPSSVHRSGQHARKILEEARTRVAGLIGAPARSIVFTSGGTEANNFAAMGAARGSGGRRRIITSSIEHSSILAPVAELERAGYAITRLQPDRDGRIVPDQVAQALDGETALVTLGLANAEVGTIQDASAIAEVVAPSGALFHLDAAQAVGRMPIDASAMGCDLMTLSAHKMGGSAGIGALYVRPGSRIEPLILGGPQEGGLRAGTPNLIGAAGFGAAAEEIITKMDEEIA
ncbi:MAG: aminotransferase class V-fold PLP-dependent enzyme, partial [Candidatus Binataceae bacterium]